MGHQLAQRRAFVAASEWYACLAAGWARVWILLAKCIMPRGTTSASQLAWLVMASVFAC